MSLSWCTSSTKYLSPVYDQQHNRKPCSFSHFTLPLPAKLTITNPNFSSSKWVIRSLNAKQNYEPTLENYAEKPEPEPIPVSRWQNLESTAASLYPVYVTVGAIVACFRPSTFSFFVDRAPFSYSLSLGFIMLSMGLTLELRDLLHLFKQRPFSILVDCVAQYTIMPSLGVLVSKFLGLPPAVSIGLILLACCPGGTASNVCILRKCCSSQIYDCEYISHKSPS